jgi:WD40 repeat protein
LVGSKVSANSGCEIWQVANPKTPCGRSLRTRRTAADIKLLISGADALGVWDVASGKLIKTLPSGTQGLAYSPDGQWLVTNPSGKLEVWSTQTWTLGTISPAQSAYIWWMGFGPAQPPSGDLSRSGVKWWLVGEGTQARSLWGATYPTTLSPDGMLLATAAARGGIVSIWNTATGEMLQTFTAHNVGVNTVFFSPDGKWLLTAGQESRIDPANFAGSMASLKHSIKLWEVGTWQERLALPFTGMTGGFSGFSPDGHMLAVGRAESNSTTLYSVPDGHELKSLAGDGTGRLAFSQDGLWVAQGFNLWNLGSPGK